MKTRRYARYALLVAQLGLGSCATRSPDESSTEQAVIVNYYVSPTGSGNQCKSTSPCSLATAQAKVRAAAPTMSGDINVYLKNGTYVLTQTLQFGPADSGRNGYSVVWQAEAGATPVISGQRSITGWTLHDAAKNIWRASATGLKTRQLYVNGVRAQRARSANEPVWQYVKERATGFVRADNHQLVAYARHDDLEISDYASWKYFRCPVQSVTPGFRNRVYRSEGNGAFVRVESPDYKNVGYSWTNDGIGEVRRYTGDFNGDGKADLLHQFHSGGWRIDVYLSAGDTFSYAGTWLSGSGTTLHVGDWNGDGKDDLLFPYGDSSGWHNMVALSDGTTGFYWPANPDWLPNQGQGNVTYHIGDWNGDFRDDILFAYSDGVAWRNVVALASPSGGFYNTGDWLTNAGQGTTYSVGDWNGDRYSDLLFSYSDASGRHNVVVLSNGSTGFYWPFPSDWLPGGGTGAVYSVGDWDGDLRDDLLLSYSDATGWHNKVALSTGMSFSHPANPDWLPNIGQNASYLIGDFTGDVKEDVLVASNESVITMHPTCWNNVHLHNVESVQLNEVGWFENAYELIDEPGEWYHDEVTSLTYYKPRAGESMSSASVVAPVLEALVEGAGALDSSGNPVFVENIQFKNLTFSYNTWLLPRDPDGTSHGYSELQAGWHHQGVPANAWDVKRSPGAVRFSRARNIRFERNRFRKLGSVGLDFSDGSQNNVIVGNHFTDISHTAIQIGNTDNTDAYEPDPNKHTTNNAVRNNYIRGVALEYRGGVGIFYGYSDSGVIEHNELHDLPYTGISLGWGWGVNSYATQNVLARNYIHEVVHTLADGGGIYTLSKLGSGPVGSALNTRIQQNYIRDVGDDVAIYLDEASRFIDATSNVIETPYAYWTSLFYGSIIENTVQNNWARTDIVHCALQAGASTLCNFGGNIVNSNTFVTGAWPSGAQSVIDAAGIQATYADIKNW